MSTSFLPRFVPALAVLAAVAIPIAGCGDSSSSSDSAGNAGADPAAFLPAAAPVYVEAQVQPTGDLKANATTVASKILRTADPGGKIVGLIDKGLKDDGASYEQDIAPVARAAGGPGDHRHRRRRQGPRHRRGDREQGRRRGAEVRRRAQGRQRPRVPRRQVPLQGR